MKRITLLLSLLNIGFLAISQDTLVKQRPNILLIIADDLGYSDIGAYGGEIATPTLDRLAATGIRFSNFHTLPSCAPTRSVLLTGADNHLVGIGGQAPGGITSKQQGLPGYEGYLNHRVAVIPELLKATGYRTYHVGKWHLGTEEGKRPFDRGFQESFTLLPGGASHYADQKPLHPGEPAVYSRNGQLLASLSPDFYSTKNYTDSVLTWLERDTMTNAPFLAHLAYTAPHDPLHAPQKYIEKYRDRYQEGYETLRERRFNALKNLGLIEDHHSLTEWSSFIPKWSELSAEEQQLKSRDMEIYAAMVDYLDEQIARVYQWLEANGELDNTLIVFMSDNGANGFTQKIYPTHTPEFATQFDNSLANRGQTNSFSSIGAGWATASTAAFRMFKLFSTEGGIRAPMIIKPPKLSNNQEEIKLGTINHSFIHVKDLMPTFLDFAKVVHPAVKNPKLVTMSGQSLQAIFDGKDMQLSKRGIGYELHGTRAFIKGDWKILQTPMPMGTGDWELFNLKKDPMETQNLIFSEKERFDALFADYQKYEKENGVVYDLPGPLRMTNRVFRVIFWLLIGIFTLAILGKLSGLMKGKYLNWGYGIPFMYGLAFSEAIATISLFTIYYSYAVWFLLIIMVGVFFTLIKNRENGKSYFLPIITTMLLVIFLILKSGRLIQLLL